MPRVSRERLIEQFTTRFVREGVSEGRARRVAELYAQASADGVHSHGAVFVPVLLDWLRRGLIADTENPPERVGGFGAFERYDGRRGFGALNAEFCIDRAMALAEEHGVGAVGLRNTGHWGRPGNCGWRAAERGFLAICWTNTLPVLPAWGGHREAVGNNPIVFAAPGEGGAHLVLDMALSQFSVGRLNTHRAEEIPLPVAGGVDAAGNPTTDAAAILGGGKAWPAGFWKGSGLALMLDAFAAVLADGLTTSEIAKTPEGLGVSQVFIAFAPEKIGAADPVERTREIVRHLAEMNPESRYPGRAALEERERSAREGVYVRQEIWEKLGLEA
jgi:Malate/L-lactate dehydrogenases